MSIPRLVILVVWFASIALADDFKTINGKEYKNVTVSRVEADGIVLKSKSGISKVYFVELPKEVQQRFHYDPQKTEQYRVAEAEAAKQRVQQQQPPSPAALETPGNIFTAKVAAIRAEHEQKIKAAVDTGDPEQTPTGKAVTQRIDKAESTTHATPFVSAADKFASFVEKKLDERESGLQGKHTPGSAELMVRREFNFHKAFLAGTAIIATVLFAIVWRRFK